jgi:hypothetical protein
MAVSPLTQRPPLRAWPAVRGFLSPGARTLAVLLCALAACRGPGGQSRAPGLRSADREPPPGAEVFARPTWSLGDEFAYRRAEWIDVRYTVLPVAEGFELADAAQGRSLWLDRDLGQLREGPSGAGPDALRFEPVDPAFAWPLWAGKRWTAEFLLHDQGQSPIRVEARYHCDALEVIQVPAGTFRCLRIWRRDRVAGPGNYLERVSLDWYSPEVGYLVRRIEDGYETVLVSYQRQAR